MKKVLFLFWLFSTFLLYGQEVSVKVDEDVVLGKNLLTDTDITGKTHRFSYQYSSAICKLNIDTLHRTFLVHLRNVSYSKKNGQVWDLWGRVVQYNQEFEKIKWEKIINYNTDYVQQFDNLFFYGRNNKSYLLDSETGKELQKLKHHICFSDVHHDLVLGYNRRGLTSNLCAINLTTNKQLWVREIENPYGGWDDVFYLNDSTIMIVAAGLHTVNLKTGKGFNYKTITGKADQSAAANSAIVFMAGLSFGVVGILIATAATEPTVNNPTYGSITGAMSNLIINDDYIYMASAAQIVKLNMNTGAVVWKSIFPEVDGSKSTIFIKDSKIYLINFGYAYKNGARYNFGNPFIAAYNKDTGKREYITYFDRIEQILDFQHLDEENIQFILSKRLIINKQPVLNKRLINFNLASGIVTSEEIFEGDNLNEYSVYLDTKSYKFMTNGEKTFIVNSEGITVAELEVGANSVLVGNSLYSYKKNTVSIIDLTDILVEDTQ